RTRLCVRSDDRRGRGLAGSIVSMQLQQLLSKVEVGPETDSRWPNWREIEVAEVRDDSRAVGPSDLFVAVRGQTVDGHRFLAQAALAGAGAAVVESISPEAFPGPQMVVGSSARALGQIAANRYARPADALTMVGVTGTNGKTTTTFLVEGLIRAAGGLPGVLGT